MRFSERSHVDLRRNRLATAIESRAGTERRYLDLTVSNPTRVGLPDDGPAILAGLSSEAGLRYQPEPFGLPAARETIAALWVSRGIPVPASSVVLTASTSEAYSFLFKLLCDPGDSVLVPRPSYPLLEHLCRYEGAVVTPYSLRYDGAWHIDFASLSAAITPRTRAIVTVSPNNPTGSYLKRDELARLAGFGLPLVSDEVFAAYPASPGGRRAVSALETPDTLVFALDGLSKLAALPQMKLAWIGVGGPPALVTDALARLELICDSFLSPGAMVQHALPSLLEASAVTRHGIQRRLAANLAALTTLLAGTPLTPLGCEGGWYAVVRLPALRSEEEWILGLLEQRDVLVQPGYFYDFETEPFAVLSLLTEEATFLEGLRRLVAFT